MSEKQAVLPELVSPDAICTCGHKVCHHAENIAHCCICSCTKLQVRGEIIVPRRDVHITVRSEDIDASSGWMDCVYSYPQYHACERQLLTLLQSLADAGIEVKDGKVFRPQRDNDFLYAAEYAGVPFDRAAAVAVALAHRGWRTPLALPTDSTKEVPDAHCGENVGRKYSI